MEQTIMKRYFVTIFDHRYLPRGLAMYQSLLAHCPNFKLWVLALTPECFENLNNRALPNLVPIKLNDIEDRLIKLMKAKQNRTLLEYYYTLSSATCRYFIDEVPKGDILTYLDSDLFFFSSPERIFNILGQSSVGITPHRFSKRQHNTKKVGDYNVGWISFRNDFNGMVCLEWWYERCIEWCYARYEDGKYADQGYLNLFPIKFDSVTIIDEPGINLAPWNLANYRISRNSHYTLIDQVPLVFFHFANFTQILPFLYSTSTATGKIWLTPTIRKQIFYPYIQALRKVEPTGLPRGLRNNISLTDYFSKITLRKMPSIIKNKIQNLFFMQYIFVIWRKYL